MSEAHDIELLYDVWEQNIETLRVLHRSTKIERARHRSQLWSATYGLAPSLSSSAPATEVQHPVTKGNGGTQHKIDKSVLTISEPKRHPLQGASAALSPSSLVSFADDHLATLITSVTPNQRGLALKVSDEFTVPLCAIHHSENHSTGNERQMVAETQPRSPRRGSSLMAGKLLSVATYCTPNTVSPPIDLKLLNVEFAARIPISG